MPLTNAEKQKRYRERLKNNPTKKEEIRKKNLERINRKTKKIADMSEEEKNEKRELWRKQPPYLMNLPKLTKMLLLRLQMPISAFSMKLSGILLLTPLLIHMPKTPKMFLVSLLLKILVLNLGNE